MVGLVCRMFKMQVPINRPKMVDTVRIQLNTQSRCNIGDCCCISRVYIVALGDYYCAVYVYVAYVTRLSNNNVSLIQHGYTVNSVVQNNHQDYVVICNSQAITLDERCLDVICWN